AAVLLDGVATLTVRGLVGSVHNLTAVYNGDARSSASTSNNVNVPGPSITGGGIANTASFQPGLAVPNTVLTAFGTFNCAAAPQALLNFEPAEIIAFNSTVVSFTIPPNFGGAAGDVSVHV